MADNLRKCLLRLRFEEVELQRRAAAVDEQNSHRCTTVVGRRSLMIPPAYSFSNQLFHGFWPW